MTDAPVYRDTDSGDSEARELRDLVASPGWARLAAWLETQWGAVSTLHRLSADLSNIPSSDIAAQSARTRDYLNARNVADEIKAWPEQRLKALEPGLPHPQLVTPRRAG